MLRRLLVLVALVVVSGCGGGRTALQAAATHGRSASADDFRPKPSPHGCVLCAETNPLLVVDKDGHATGTIRLRNRGTDPLTLQLFVSQFTTAGDGEPDDLDATTTLTVADAMTKAVVADNALQPNAAFDVTITATNLWQPGPSVARLMNGTEKVIDLRALRYTVPFNLKIDGPTPERADLSFAQNRETSLTLRNDDPMTYRFRWNVEIDGHAMGGVEKVPPNKAVRLKLQMPPENFTWVSSGTLRSDTRAGVLTLELEPHESLRNYPFPVKRYPIAASLSYWNEPWQGLWNSASILFLLLLGISSSMLVNFILPLQKKRVAIKQRLYDIEGRLAGLDELIDPIDGRLLSQMRVEKKRLRLELRGLLPVFPQSGVDMPRLEERLENLMRRITWVSTVGALLQSVQRHSATMSLREVELFRAHCGEILSIAGKATAEATDVAEIDRQMAALAVPSPDAGIPGTLLEDVLKTSQALRQKIRDFTSNPSWEPCSKLLATLESDFPPVPQVGAESDFPPARADFVRHEVAIRKAALLVEYMELVNHSPDDTIHQGRLAQRERLLEALKPGPDESLSSARDVVDQTVQNVYLNDVLHEISAKAVYIDVDPATPLAYQLTDIGLRFRRPGVDDAAARHEVACEWTIDGEPLPSRDWSVTYFFTDRWRLLKAMLAKVMRSRVDPDRSRIQVTLKERGKEDVLLELDHNLVLERTKSAVEAQTWLSAGSLLVTLLLIGFGLATGAEEKLRSLDLVPGAIAVFVLGFGADALKTLITRNSE